MGNQLYVGRRGGADPTANQLLPFLEFSMKPSILRPNDPALGAAEQVIFVDPTGRRWHKGTHPHGAFGSPTRGGSRHRHPAFGGCAGLVEHQTVAWSASDQ